MHSEDDDDYQMIIKLVVDHPEFPKLPDSHPANLYKNMWLYISVDDNLLWYDGRIIVPVKYRKTLLKLLHRLHEGTTRTRQMAASLYFWPGMANEIWMMVENCPECQLCHPSNPVRNESHTEADYLMEQVSMDLFYCQGDNYLVVVDRFSNYPFVEYLRRTATSDVMDKLTSIFNLFGFPKVVRTDGGPQFLGEFDEYCDSHGIHHEMSSPYHPQSNGHAESAVKNMKHLMLKCGGNAEEFEKAL